MNRQSRNPGNPWADHYTRQAKHDHFAARSVYKLQEIQKKYHILRKGDRVLDLGCAPGSWLQFAAAEVGTTGRVAGIDLSPVTLTLPDHVTVVTGDVADFPSHLSRLEMMRVHVVLSDMAPSTTGNAFVDVARSVGLAESALSIADQVLLTGGHFVCKIFQGADFKVFADQVKQRFDRQTALRPQSTRKASREVFIIGLGKKNGKSPSGKQI
ncbi:RlmE family RNA methyltransferase [Desulfosarcina sp. OttesenSCG-928-A07]|nr:RlmE family RNA methyltransferase [Desulfosarcina sp. OttesenSCG-928-G17]MDL2328615.1 RlmE family RNA methyltransferase [Desulfosarcina sp. OttesenSCG-928-A07]